MSSDRMRLVLRSLLIGGNMIALGRGRRQVGKLLWTWWTWWTLWTSVDGRGNMVHKVHSVHKVHHVHSVRFTPAARSPAPLFSRAGTSSGCPVVARLC